MQSETKPASGGDKKTEKERIDEMIEVIMKVARGDYSVQVKPSGKNDDLDSLAVGINMMIDDIKHTLSERKKAEVKIEAEKEKLETYIESMVDGVVVTDAKGAIVQANKSYAEMLDYKSPKELIGKLAFEIIAKKDRSRMMKVFMEAMRKKTHVFKEVELTYLKKDSKEIPIMISVRNVWDKKGKLVYAISVVRDITERKKAEEELQTSETKYKNLAENLQQLIYRADPETFFPTYVNNAVELIYGYTTREWLENPKLWESSVHPDDKDKILIKIREAQKKTKSVMLQYRIIRKDKMLRWVEDHVNWEKDRQGNVVSVAGIMYDITERKKTEWALKERFKEIECLYKVTNSIRSEKPLEKLLVDVTKYIKEAWQYPEITRVRITFDGKEYESIKFKETEFKQTADISVKGKLRGAIEVYYLEKMPESDEGSFLKEERKLLDEIASYLGAYIEKEEIEGKIQESERKYRTLLENLPQKIFFKDRKSVYISCNENYAKDLKIKPEEIAGKTDYEFYPKKLAEKYRGDDKRLMEAGKTEDIEEDYIQDGQKVFVHTVKTPVRDEKGKIIGILGVFWNITEEKEMEKQIFDSNKRLQRAAQELKVAIETKGEFMNIAAHELRTPLQPIIGYADRLLQERNPTDWQKERLNIILDNAKNLLKLVQDVLDINKMETGIMKFSMGEVDLLKIIKEVYDSFKPVVEEKGLKFILDTSKAPDKIKIKGDPSRLNQVFANLLDNAVKFTGKGTITIQLVEDKNSVMISVQDTGIGIAEKDIPKLFTKFFQADVTNKRKRSGTGLGLVICKEIVKAHKGKISAQSILGKGSTFTVVLPKLTRPARRKEVESG